MTELEELEKRLRAYIDAEISSLERHIDERFERTEKSDAKIRDELRRDIRQVTNEIQDLDLKTRG